MKMIFGYRLSDIYSLLRLCLPATVFIGLCTSIFVAFIFFLGTIASANDFVIGGAWLSLFIFYLILGIAFIRFAARHIHSVFGSEELRIQKRMASLSGIPFYALCMLFLMASIIAILFPDNINAATGFISIVGFFGFVLVSCGYILLIHFFLGRSTVITQQ